MIIVMKKSNVILIGLIFALLLAIYSLNMTMDTQASATGSEVVKTVILDAGHGGEDPGKVSGYNDLKEKDLTLKITLRVRDLLQAENVRVILTREEDKLTYQEGTTSIYEKRKQDLTRRKEIMDSSGAQIVVSIHLNSFPETKYFGAQTFYPSNSPESLKLAEDLQKSLRSQLDSNNKRGPQEKKDAIVILTDLKTPTVIVECGFLSNPDEEKKLGTEEYQQKIAEAIRDGILTYYK